MANPLGLKTVTSYNIKARISGVGIQRDILKAQLAIRYGWTLLPVSSADVDTYVTLVEHGVSEVSIPSRYPQTTVARQDLTC